MTFTEARDDLLKLVGPCPTVPKVIMQAQGANTNDEAVLRAFVFQSATEKEREQIKLTLSKFLSYKPFEFYTHPNPETYLNQKRWQDVIPENVIKVEPKKQKVIIW